MADGVVSGMEIEVLAKSSLIEAALTREKGSDLGDAAVGGGDDLQGDRRAAARRDDR